MKRKTVIWAIVLLLCLGTVMPAMAANTFLFEKILKGHFRILLTFGYRLT